jgi:hypothetical protein
MSEMTLRLPMNYVEVERDEMEYIDGGAWSSYRGLNAVRELSVMIANTLGWGRTTVGLCQAALASAATGIGVLLSIGLAMGIAISATIASVEGCLDLIAIADLKKDGGFQDDSTSVGPFTFYYGVAEL